MWIVSTSTAFLQYLVVQNSKCAEQWDAPTSFRKKFFGKNVEGLSYLRDESCAVEVAVQTDDFED